MTKRRNRGVLLDRNIVQFYAKKLGILSFGKFEQHIFKTNPHHNQNCKAAHHAWYGKESMDRKFADDIARSLQLDNYECLISGNTFTSAWKNLINNESYQESFLTFSDHSKSDLHLVKFNAGDNKELDKVPLSAQWHLDFSGHKNDLLFIILQSDSVFYQLAPIDIEGHSNEFKIHIMRYPEKTNFSFDPSCGLGWRRIIAVRSQSLPLDLSDRDVSMGCTLDELNLFASRLMEINNNTLSIDKYEFEIVE